MSTEETLTIQEVGQRCGVNPVTLRAWERRYGLIRPARTERGHRRYVEADVARIHSILAWLDRGLPISQVCAVLEQGTPPEAASGPWRQAMEEAWSALDDLNVRRLEQLFRRLTGDYPLEKVVSGWCEPLRSHLRTPGRLAARTLFDSFLRLKLSGPLLAATPSRRQHGWLVMAVGDPLPGMLQAALSEVPVWSVMLPVAGTELGTWLNHPRLDGLLWVLGEHPVRRQSARWWPKRTPGFGPALWCCGPALTSELSTPEWLARCPGDFAEVAQAMRDWSTTMAARRGDDASDLVP
ncbi:MerR family transcriptional regulator [Alcanivorax sp. 24]|uniref:MerR family transcriptional regulator n=1 Tax=Alcanivorax sp. 24 TaxID=2545266 RepID=UPI00105E0510|nr:MerR family transcriptional regulator [Alcanivorax sp. 24]